MYIKLPFTFLGQMSHEYHHWHATNECFHCFNCKIELLGKPFLPRKGAVYCSIVCSKMRAKEYSLQEECATPPKVEHEQQILVQDNMGTKSIEWSSKASGLDLSAFNSMSLG